MNLENLIKSQDMLNEFTFAQHGMDWKKEKIDVETWVFNFTTAFIQELGEFYEERMNSSMMLIEYVDMLHFLLSLAIILDVDLEFKPEIGNAEIGDLLVLAARLKDTTNWKWWKAHHKFEVQKARDIFNDLWVMFLRLGSSFSWKDVERAYYLKNKLNFERMENDYGGKYQKYANGREDNYKIIDVLQIEKGSEDEKKQA